MRFPTFTLLAAAFSVAVVSSIPIAPQQALLEIQSSETDVTQLLADIVQSNLQAAQIEYAIVQKDLDNLGMYLGQLTNPTCVSSGPTSGTISATSQTDVLVTLQQLQLDMMVISAGIVNSSPETAIAAYTAAQAALETTYGYIFA
ncbi:hypothetical protein LTR91_001244 [Friedmanniomyces endolithicus]|uniref:Cell wall protein n=1 Tax=Friedmanniomyces endolithicus TaxID=329885 RepID=A0AAN6L3S5_9PEZI|nr:hypothetical protein LTR35_012539 [Friedmanniomyces endolithicus]KAK0283936.1 hypothetical protein LTS00_011600 [Friedmanniomyces endolithicus]KAK0312802.1 hypothetical protein LTR01_002464 [Friedmanniomyces endolithicus]KAK0320353.1 hypothetical protein LTR82_008467 [Friedmanniomyces endolithicus]KAK0829086.1 hypothetical protein LTR73_004720 [Friedmanniomyces endolithicus]